MKADVDILLGTNIQKTTPPTMVENETINFNGYDVNGKHCSFGLTSEQLHTHLLSVGSTGSGKSTAMFQALDQILPTVGMDDVVIIFDAGGEFLSRYYQENNLQHFIIGNHPKAFSWSLFSEFQNENGLFLEDSEMFVHEIVKQLFEPYMNYHQPFYTLAPKDIVCAFINHTIDKLRKGEMDKVPRIEGTVEFLKNCTIQDWKDFFKNSSHFSMIQDYLGDGRSPQALGIMSELHTIINDIFTMYSIHPRNNNVFSIRHLLRERGGMVCFIEYDLALEKTQSTLLKVWYDIAIKFALAENSKRSGNVYLICDELSLMPNLNYLSSGLNYGRKHHIMIYAAIQSISQLEVAYGKEECQSILAGFCNCFLFRCFEKSTRTYASDRLGKNISSISYGNESSTTREGSVIEDWDLLKLKPGESYIHLSSCEPFFFKFDLTT